MDKILMIIGKEVREFANAQAVLEWAILQLREQTKQESAKASAKADATIAKIVEPVKETPQESPKEVPKGDAKVPNSFDLPAMRRPFFGGKDKQDKGELLSYAYTINGETPRARPADTCRILFTRTSAYASMPPKEKDRIVNWGLSFLKKQVRETGKVASCETTMVVPFSIDRFAFLAGAKVIFRVSIKKD